MADSKITGLSADTAPTSDDLVVTVNDPAGTPANKKVALGDLPKGFNALSYSGTTAISGTGDTVITGVGFTPNNIIIFAQFAQSFSGTHNNSHSHGYYNRGASTQGCVYGASSPSSAGGSNSTTKVINVVDGAGGALCTGTVSATSADGFTINITANTGTNNLIWTAYR